MLFTEPTFLFLFLPVLLGLYFVSRGAAWRNLLLLAASLVFYASGGGSFLLLMVSSIAVNYVLAVVVDRTREGPAGRLVLGLSVAGNLAVLAWFKYANFLADNLNLALGAAGGPHLVLAKVLLPIGISFFTFHAISYVVDVYRGHAVAQKNPVHAALYMLLFPQLIAGPIIRYREIADQLASRVVEPAGFAYGVRRFVVGLAKKVIVANTVAGPADGIFALPAEQLTAPLAWIGIACYTVQIYFDFSGYSDMAIGLAAMFGFRFPENFRYPYVARSVQEFWRRWHISLSSWFRDYLYIPLGGNRVPTARVALNLLLVFFLCGLWHGASWTFVVWGLFHGAFLGLERAGLGDWLSRRPAWLGHVYAMAVATIGWVFFRAQTSGHALAFLAALAGAGGGAPTPYAPGFYLDRVVALALVLGAVGATPWPAAQARRVLERAQHEPAAPPRRLAASFTFATLALLFVVSAVLIASNTYSPFIYFRF